MDNNQLQFEVMSQLEQADALSAAELERRRTMLIAWLTEPGIGRKTVEELIVHGNFADYADFTYADWRSLGLEERRAEALTRAMRKFTAQATYEDINKWHTMGITTLTPFDEAYPSLLREIPDRPWLLFARGDLALLEHNARISMVGTRAPSGYGRKMTGQLASELAAAGFTIVSGMALGIDGIAHTSALAVQGKTIAVLGTAIDDIYPESHRKLYADIWDKGLLLSEYPPATKRAPGLFPMRNRIIAGLSVGTVVVEAAERSGSLITAKLALEYDRDVFAVPGEATAKKSAGTNTLIRLNGAKLITESVHITDSLIGIPDLSWSTIGVSDIVSPLQATLTAEEGKIMRILDDDPKTADELQRLTDMSFGQMHTNLINLMVKQKVVLQGAVYKRI